LTIGKTTLFGLSNIHNRRKTESLVWCKDKYKGVTTVTKVVVVVESLSLYWIR